jgi:hypothetical protein
MGKVGPNGASKGMVQLPGLLFGCSKEETVPFFHGLEIVPNGVQVTRDCQGRSRKRCGKTQGRIGWCRNPETFRNSRRETTGFCDSARRLLEWHQGPCGRTKGGREGDYGWCGS